MKRRAFFLLATVFFAFSLVVSSLVGTFQVSANTAEQKWETESSDSNNHSALQPWWSNRFKSAAVQYPTKIEGIPSSVTLNIGGTFSIHPVFLPLDAIDKGLKYSVSDKSIVSYGSRTVTALKAGKATISFATADTKFKTTLTVTVANSTTAHSKCTSYSSWGYCTTCGKVFTISLTKMSETYYAVKDSVPVRNRAYSPEPTVRTLAKNEKVTVVGRGKNSQGNLWYRLSDGTWVFSDNLTKDTTNTAPAKPTLTVSKNNVTTSPVKFTWAKVANATEYDIRIFQGDTLKYSKFSMTGTSLSFSNMPAGNYTAYLAAVNKSANRWTYSDTISFTVSPAAHTKCTTYNELGYCTTCGKVFNMSPTTMSATYYAVKDDVPVRERPYSKEPTIKTLAKNEKVTVTGSGKNSLGKLWYRIIDGKDEFWIFSENLTKTTPSITPAKPTLTVSKNNVPSSPVKFTWVKVAGATEYDLRIYQGSTLKYSKFSMTGTSYSLSKMPAGNYTAKLAAVNKSANKWTYSDTVSFTVNPEYTVTFHSNGGSAVKAQTIASGKTINAPANPKKSGYLFKGWYTAESGGSKIPFPYEPKKNITLYAQWNKAYTVKFDAKGGVDEKGASATCEKTIAVGKTVNAPANPNKSGYLFKGWYTAESGGSKIPFPYEPKKNITLYAQWNKAYTVKFDPKVRGIAISSKMVIAGKAMNAPKESINNGYTFKGWYTKESEGTKINFPYTPTKNVTLYAQWNFNWVWPLPASYKVTSPYGYRGDVFDPVTGKKLNSYSSHYGIDIGRGENDPVVSVADGIVIKTRESRTAAGGITILIRHYNGIDTEGGLYTKYFHLDSIDKSVKEGGKAKRNQQIGISGNTGGVPLHLHFQVQRGIEDATAINPLEHYDDKDKRFDEEPNPNPIYKKLINGVYECNPSFDKDKMRIACKKNKTLYYDECTEDFKYYRYEKK